MARTWTPDFDFYPTLVDGRPASIVVDLAADPHVPLPGCGVLVSVKIPMKHPRPDGLRDAAELPPLARLEDAVVSALEGAVAAVSVGRLMLAGVLVLYLYVPDDTATSAVADALGDVDWDGYPLRWSLAPDPTWQLHRELLEPDPYTRQGIWNRRLLAQFAARGDDPEALREIDHAATFPSPDAAAAAGQRLQALGFRLDDPAPGEPSRLSFHREDWLANGAPDEFVSQILEVVLTFGGQYDGWGAPVMQAAIGEA